MPRPYQERVDVTSVLKNILDNYPAGGAVLRELLQNSDDAGAQSQVFVLDSRSHPEDGLPDPILRKCQGPALLAINDSVFREKDWEALTNIHDSSKSADETTTGKYGLGFRSCYHVTDNPEIYSTTSLLILDPHKEFAAPYAGGMRLDSSDVSSFPNMYQPFATFAPNLEHHQGTVIRLPLRSGEQAKRSRIKSGSDAEVTVALVQDWFDHFITTELPVVMLFLKHITSIELQVVSDSTNIRTIASTRIVNTHADNVLEKRSVNRGRIPEASQYFLEIDTQIGEEHSKARWMITQFVHDYAQVEQELSRGLGRPVDEVEAQMKKDKLLPHVALALPLSAVHDVSSVVAPLEGKLFSLLPLPIITDFPLHVHAIFALLSSRQHLRNSQEDVGKASREGLLIEWNRLIFNTMLPGAWSSLLQTVTSLEPSVDLYSVWPRASAISKQGDAAYWSDFPLKLLEQTASYPIWPQVNDGKRVALKDALVASKEAVEILQALQATGLSIIRPLTHIVDLISNSPFRKRLLSPLTACSALLARLPQLQALDRSQIDVISEYMASARDTSLFQQLPLIRNVSGAFVPLNSTLSLNVFASQQEAALFGEMNPYMLALEKMLPKTKKFLAKEMTRPNHTTVLKYLDRFHPRNYPQGTAANGPFEWLCRFWDFMSSWSYATSLLDNIKNYIMLPTGKGTVRRVSAKAFDPEDVQEHDGLLESLEYLDVPILHIDMGSSAKAYLKKARVIAARNDVGFLLSEVRPAPVDETSLNQGLRLALSKHIRRQLPTSNTRLTQGQITTLRGLPVFPILPIGDRSETGPTASGSRLAAAGSSHFFVDQSVSIIPDLKDVTFIDGASCPELVAALTGSTSMTNEVAVLQLVLRRSEQWSQQPGSVAEKLVNRFFNRFSDLSPPCREMLRKLPFVDVGGRVRPPTEVVDPSASIATLFSPADQVLPTGRFSDGGGFDSPLGNIRSRGFLQTALSNAMIDERIRGMERSRMLTLLEVIDKHYLSQNQVHKDFLPASLFSVPWISISDRLHCVGECRDRQVAETLSLYDLVTPVVDYRVRSVKLRKLLGWDVIPRRVVVEQMRKTVDLGEATSWDKSRRISALIAELAEPVHSKGTTHVDLGDLHRFLNARPWIPMVNLELEYSSRCVIEPLDLGSRSRFKRLPYTLLNSPKIVTFLENFGVCRSPLLESLISELDYLKTLETSTQKSAEEVVGTATAILTEISTRNNLSKDQGSTLQIPIAPDADGSVCFRPIGEVCYNDGNDADTSLIHPASFAHPSISSQLAKKLGMQQRSDLEFEHMGEDDFESFDVGEDLTTRIRNVLKGYSVEASSNEWVANAADAGASEVSFICNEQRFKIRAAPSPALIHHFEGPSLIVHNSATFSDHDFDGLRKVGLGGKSATPDSIGRFGLGVLSFYHFGDIIMLVSGWSVVFLDPSGENLPRGSRDRGGEKRTGLRMSIRECRTRYPDLFLPINGMEGFDASKDYYEGTIFFVPLRGIGQPSRISSTPVTASSVVDLIEGSFFYNAENSLFFTRITSIRGCYRSTSGIMHASWSITGTRQDQEGTGGMQRQNLTLKVSKGDAKVSEWLVTSRKADLPSGFRSFAEAYRLPSIIPAAVAIQRKPLPPTQPPHTLFATLPLPLKTALNLHIHSQWILSDSRRHLHLESSNEQSQGLDIRFNKWLLSELIPPLILYTISVLNIEEPSSQVSQNLWPTGACFEGPSDCLIAENVYRVLPTCNELLFRTTNGRMVSPPDAVFGVSGKPSVSALLQQLCPDTFVIPGFDMAPVISRLSLPITTDSAGLVRSTLLDRVNASRVIEANLLENMDVDSLIWYLLDGGQSLNGLPLLRLQSGTTIRFTQIDPLSTPIFEYNAAIANLFGPDYVITQTGGGKLWKKTVDAILEKEGGGNLDVFDMNGLKKLLAGCQWAILPDEAWLPEDYDGAVMWVGDFWRACVPDGLSSFKLELKAEDLEDLPLLPTVGGPLISLSSCRTQVAFWREDTFRTQTTREILEIIVELGGRVIDLQTTFPLKLSDDYKIYRDVGVDSVLQCMSGLQVNSADILVSKVSPQSWRLLASWMTLSPLNLLLEKYSLLRKLPLWEARQANSTSRVAELRPLDGITMLPQSVTLSTVSMFMGGGGTWFTEYSYSLGCLLRPNRILDIQDFARLLHLPSTLALESIPDFLRLLETLQRLGARNMDMPFVPNCNLRLSRPKDLFHEGRVPIYSFAFQHRPDCLIHHDFRHLTGWFEQMGLEVNVTSAGFLAAITAIDSFIHNGLELHVTDPGCEGVFDQLNQEPWVFQSSMRESAFQRMRGLRFVPSRQLRRSIPDFEVTAIPLPDVLSLDQLVREEYTLVAWTQRARFAVEPSSDLQAVFPMIGVPSAGEVVAHLIALADAVRQDPERGSLLIDDLKATYHWLDQHSEDARSSLSNRGKQPIFWNVDDGSEDMRTWRSASSMWLNVTWDDEPNQVFSVRSLLGQYPRLLGVAGVREYPRSQWSGPTPTPATYVNEFHSSMSLLRSNDQLTDVVLHAGDGAVLKAHRVVLAASSPHFQRLFTGEWREGSLSVSPDKPADLSVAGFAGSEISSALHYIYTGEFKPLDASIHNAIDASNALASLVSLLDLCNQWSLDGLKLEAEKSIIELDLVGPSTVNALIERCQAAEARTLLEHCTAIRTQARAKGWNLES